MKLRFVLVALGLLVLTAALGATACGRQDVILDADDGGEELDGAASDAG